MEGRVVLDVSGGSVAMNEHAVVIAGGGPAGMMLAADLEFPGWDPTTSNLIAEAELTEEPPAGVRHDAAGVHGFYRMQDGKTFRVVTTEQQLGRGGEPTLRELSEALIAVYGTDFGI